MEDPLKSVGVICVSGKVPICFCIGIGWSSKWINGVISRGGSDVDPLGARGVGGVWGWVGACCVRVLGIGGESGGTGASPGVVAGQLWRRPNASHGWGVVGGWGRVTGRCCGP